MQWQPIDTAPKNGVRILMPYFGKIHIATFGLFRPRNKNQWIIEGAGDDNAFNINPTHWMPLPEFNLFNKSTGSPSIIQKEILKKRVPNEE